MVSIHAIFYVPVSMTKLPCNYSLQIRMKDKKTKMTFVIGQMDTDWHGYPPKNSMASVNAYINYIHDSYFSAIKNQTKADDF